MARLLVQWLEQNPALVSAVILSLLPILMLLAKHSRVATKKKKSNLPPSPSKLPIIGNLHQIGKLPHHSLRDLSLKHGPLMLLHLGQIPTLIVSSAKMARQIMKTHDLNFANRPAMTAPKHLFYDTAIAFSGYGDSWRELRKVCAIELLSSKRLQSFGFLRKEEMNLLVENISSSCTPSGLINLSNMFRSLTLNIICRVALGDKYSDSRGEEGLDGKRRFSEMARDLRVLLETFHVGDFFPFMGWVDVLTGTISREKRFAREMDNFLDQVIEDHLDPNRAETQHQDLVDVLLQLQKDCTHRIPLTSTTIKSLILDMLAGGTISFAVPMEWAMTELAKHPDVMKKAQEEIRRVVGSRLEVEESDLDQMEFLKSTIKETLRLHPPAPVLEPHQSINDIEIEGYLVPAKSMVFINAWAIQRDPESWDRGNEFRPERFMNSCIDFKGHDFQFIPFGAGRRGCPGTPLAVPVLELALANLLLRFNWELPAGVDRDDVDVSQEGYLGHKKSPLVLVATPIFS